MAFEIKDLIDPKIVPILLLFDMLGMGHAAVEDHQPIWFHLDKVEQFPIIVPIIDIGISFARETSFK